MVIFKLIQTKPNFLTYFSNLCPNIHRTSTKLGPSSLVFRRTDPGEISVVTADLEIGPMSVLQFDVSVTIL